MNKRAAPKPVPIAVLDLERMLCFSVYSTGFAFNRVYRKPLQKLGLTYPQFLVMMALWGEDGATVGRLGERLSLDTSTLTPLLKRLEGMGLVSRRRSVEDERRVLVALTGKGVAMKSEAATVLGCIVEAIGMSGPEIARLTDDIRALRANLERAADALA